MSTLLRTNLAGYRVTVTRPHLTNNAVLWSVVGNETRCPMGGQHDYVKDVCSKCTLVGSIQETDVLGHGFLYGSLTQGLETAVTHAVEVRHYATRLTAAIESHAHREEILARLADYQRVTAR